VFFRLTGAALRAVCVAMIVILPTLILPGTTQSAMEFTRIIATIVAIIVIYEYGFLSPSIIEFRFSSPYNRIRFMMLFAFSYLPAYLISINIDGLVLSGVLETFAHNGFALMDFPYSPVSIVADRLSVNNSDLKDTISNAIAINIMIGFASLLAFSLAIFSNLWRFGSEGFNVWRNLPTYLSYDADSLQQRLRNSAFIGTVIALLIPLFGPTACDIMITLFANDGSLDAITISWVIAIWTLLPVFYLMRSIAFLKLAMHCEGEESWITV
jgi:hypothetical protein